MMNEHAELYAEADDHFEHRRFAEARAIYQRLMQEGNTSFDVRFAWSMAAREEPLEFLRQLVAKHPAKFDFRLLLVRELILQRYSPQAIQLCDELLEESLDDRQKQEVHHARFRAAIRCGTYQTLSSDFDQLWAHGMRPQRHQSRVNLLDELAAITDSEAIPTLRSIANQHEGDQALNGFLRAKTTELAALSQVTGALKPE